LFCLKRTARGGFSEGDLVRRKIFGMLTMPLDRNAKARLLQRARCLMRASEKGGHYGPITAKTYAIFAALLVGFHNGQSGRCFPSYDAIAEATGCCRRMVADALTALEAAGLLGVAKKPPASTRCLQGPARTPWRTPPRPSTTSALDVSL
jgi:hypothetical protein